MGRNGLRYAADDSMEDHDRQELTKLAGALAAHLRRSRRLGPLLLAGHLPDKPASSGRPARRQPSRASTGPAPTPSPPPADRPAGPDSPSGRAAPRSGKSPKAHQDLDSMDVTAKLAQNDIPGAVGLARIKALLGECRRCPLSKTRHHIVFGQGEPSAEVMFIGEAPGAEEDRRGVPFVGAAGELLTKMLKAMGLRRKDVYISNILKCRPPNNRDPLPEEVAVCLPFLDAQIKAIEPRIIVTLGRVAAQTLLDTQASLSSLRGTFHNYKGISLMPTYHPAYLLRRPEGKRAAWHDLKLVMAEMDRLGLERDRSIR